MSSVHFKIDSNQVLETTHHSLKTKRGLSEREKIEHIVIYHWLKYVPNYWARQGGMKNWNITLTNQIFDYYPKKMESYIKLTPVFKPPTYEICDYVLKEEIRCYPEERDSFSSLMPCFQFRYQILPLQTKIILQVLEGKQINLTQKQKESFLHLISESLSSEGLARVIKAGFSSDIKISSNYENFLFNLINRLDSNYKKSVIIYLLKNKKINKEKRKFLYNMIFELNSDHLVTAFIWTIKNKVVDLSLEKLDLVFKHISFLNSYNKRLAIVSLFNFLKLNQKQEGLLISFIDKLNIKDKKEVVISLYKIKKLRGRIENIKINMMNKLSNEDYVKTYISFLKYNDIDKESENMQFLIQKISYLKSCQKKECIILLFKVKSGNLILEKNIINLICQLDPIDQLEVIIELFKTNNLNKETQELLIQFITKLNNYYNITYIIIELLKNNCLNLKNRDFIFDFISNIHNWKIENWYKEKFISDLSKIKNITLKDVQLIVKIVCKLSKSSRGKCGLAIVSLFEIEIINSKQIELLIQLIPELDYFNGSLVVCGLFKNIKLDQKQKELLLNLVPPGSRFIVDLFKVGNFNKKQRELLLNLIPTPKLTSYDLKYIIKDMFIINRLDLKEQMFVIDLIPRLDKFDQHEVIEFLLINKKSMIISENKQYCTELILKLNYDKQIFIVERLLGYKYNLTDEFIIKFVGNIYSNNNQISFVILNRIIECKNKLKNCIDLINNNPKNNLHMEKYKTPFHLDIFTMLLEFFTIDECMNMTKGYIQFQGAAYKNVLSDFLKKKYNLVEEFASS